MGNAVLLEYIRAMLEWRPLTTISVGISDAGYHQSCAEAEKMKSQTFHTQGCISGQFKGRHNCTLGNPLNSGRQLIVNLNSSWGDERIFIKWKLD